jgi:hypothetical protein
MLLRKPTSRIGSLTFQTHKYKRCSPAVVLVGTRIAAARIKSNGHPNYQVLYSTPNKYLNISLKGLQNMSLRINDIAPDFTAEPHKDRFASTSGLGIVGQSSFLTPKTLHPSALQSLALSLAWKSSLPIAGQRSSVSASIRSKAMESGLRTSRTSADTR